MQEVRAQTFPNTHSSPNFAKPLLPLVFIHYLLLHLSADITQESYF